MVGYRIKIYQNLNNYPHRENTEKRYLQVLFKNCTIAETSLYNVTNILDLKKKIIKLFLFVRFHMVGTKIIIVFLLNLQILNNQEIKIIYLNMKFKDEFYKNHSLC